MAAVTLLAVGVPLITLARWLIVGGAGIWRLDQIGAALGETVLLAGIGGDSYHACRNPDGMALNPRAKSSPAALGSHQLYRRRGAGRRHRAGAGNDRYLLRAFRVPDDRHRRGRLRGDVPAARPDQHAGEHRPGAGRTWNRRLAASGARRCRRCGRSRFGLRRRVRPPSFALVGLGITNELPATQMLAPNGVQTLAMVILVVQHRTRLRGGCALCH